MLSQSYKVRRLKSALWNPITNIANQLRRSAAECGIGLSHNDRKLIRLHNSAKGKRVFVIGNGPSLRGTDVDKLCGEISVASNGIFLLFDSKKFRPTYYTVEDTLVAEDRATEINQLKGPLKIFPKANRKWIHPAEDTLFLDYILHYPECPADTPDDSDCHPIFSTNCASKVYAGGTVTYVNLQIAYYLGASEVYLLGFDHHYNKPSQQDEQERSVIISRSDDVNHFDPRYFGDGYRWHDPRVNRMARAYEMAKVAFEADGRKIYNATAGGKLEVFERVDFDSLF